MKKWLTPSLLILLSFTAAGQRIELRGRLVDSADIPLSNAAVQLIAATDTTDTHLEFSDRKGQFRIGGLVRQPYLLEINLMGYAPYVRAIEPSAPESVIELGTIAMQPASRQLEGVTVSGRRLPMRIKDDTLEFNAAAFKTRPNAAVEELLKKLPGVEVEDDGTIRAQGEEVERVTVDGEEFFGNDPKIASRNLPADAVDKVQLFDKRSDKSMFTGIDDGEKEKTINLELKQQYRKSTFGKVTAGGGTDERFSGNAALNRFNQGQQLSILAMANNTNQQGFSIGDYINFTSGPQERRGGPGMRVVNRGGGPGGAGSGSSGGSGSGGQAGPQLNMGQGVSGIMTSWAGGVNFRDAFSDKLEVNGNYFADYLDHETDRSLERINFLPDGSYRFLQDGSQQNDHTGHRGNAILDFRPDSSNSFRLNSSFGYRQTHTASATESRTLTADEELANSSRQKQSSDGNNLDLSADLLYRHRFGKPGRTISANLEFGLGNSDRHGNLDALTQFQASDLPGETVLQDNQQTVFSRSVGGGISYTEPLSATTLLEFNYQLRQQSGSVQRDVWDLPEQAGGSDLQPGTSVDYENDYRYQRAGMNFQLNGSSFHVTAGMNFQQSRLNGELLLRDTSITRDFQSFLPSLQFRYDFAGNKHLDIEYRTRLQEPSVEELQPVVDNSDPLNLYKGNPGLRPAYVQQARLHFMTFEPSSMVHLFTFLDFNYTTDAISWSESVDEQLVRTTQPVNVGHEAELRGNANFGFPMSGINSRVGISAGLGVTRGLSLLNGEENRTRQQDLNGELRYDYHFGEILDLSLSGRVSRQRNRFDQGKDQLYVNQQYRAGATLAFLQHYGLQLDFGYRIYDSEPGDFSQEIPMLDLSVSRYLFKDNSGELRLSVDNMLDKDLGVSQQAGTNYIERSVTNSLGRYALLSFTYAINKQLSPRPPRRGPMIHMEKR